MTKITAIGLVLSAAISGYAQNGTADRAIDVIRRPAPKSFVPENEAQRFHHFLKRTFGPESAVKSAAGAGIGLWDGRPREWGEGAKGFGKRFASSYATHLTETSIEFGVSTILHEDNRYFVSQRTETKQRLLYAVESPFVARRNDGTRRVSISHISAIIGAAFISRAWQPPSTRGPGEGTVSALALVSSSVALDVVREFWPRKQ